MSFPARTNRLRGFIRRACLPGWLLGFLSCEARAEEGQAFIPRSSPAPVFAAPDTKEYNLKWGRTTGRFYGSAQTEFNDNINLASKGISDLIFSPQVGVGFLWPVNADNTMQLDVGMGYRLYMEHTELNSWSVTPDTSWNYKWRVKAVKFMVRDSFHTTIDPVERAELSGTAGNTVNFRRFSNTAGLQATWQYNSHLALTAGYDYTVDRGFNSDFSFMDRDDNTFSASAMHETSSRLTLGVTSGYTISKYLEQVQNDGRSLTFAPVATWKPTQFITLDASIGYTIADYDQTGTVADTSGYNGFTWQMGARHIINSRISHNLRFSRAISPGVASNFSELSVIQYSIVWKLNSWLGLNGTFSYEDLAASGAGDKAQRFLCYVGTTYKLSRHWNAGLSYGFAWKDAADPTRNYTQNRVTLDLTRNF